MTDDLYPMFLYVYRPDGFHEGVTATYSNQKEFDAAMLSIREHVKTGVEVVLTDPLDRCVFHANKGKILFPLPTEVIR